MRTVAGGGASQGGSSTCHVTQMQMAIPCECLQVGTQNPVGGGLLARPGPRTLPGPEAERGALQGAGGGRGVKKVRLHPVTHPRQLCHRDTTTRRCGRTPRSFLLYCGVAQRVPTGGKFTRLLMQMAIDAAYGCMQSHCCWLAPLCGSQPGRQPPTPRPSPLDDPPTPLTT